MLSTIHNSKGLEWKAVFLIGMNDQDFPSSHILGKGQDEKFKECRRLMYVSTTKAKEHLHISFIKDEKKPYICRFFSEIDDSFYKKQTEFNQNSIVKINDPFNKQLRFQKNEIVEKIPQMIESFQKKQYENMDSILSGINIYSLENGQKISFNEDYIKQNHLQQDFINYLDLYLYRSIQQTLPEKIIQPQAQILLAAIPWYHERISKLQPALNKFLKFLKDRKDLDMDKIHQHENIKKELLDQNKKLFHHLEEPLEKVFDIIKQFIQENNFKYSDIHHSTLCERHVDIFESKQEEKKQLTRSYAKFCDKNNRTIDIKQDLYNVSKCIQLSQNNKRSLYRNDFPQFKVENLDQNIQILSDYLNQKQFERIELKKIREEKEKFGCMDIVADDHIQIYLQSKLQLCIQKGYNQSIGFRTSIEMQANQNHQNCIFQCDVRKSINLFFRRLEQCKRFLCFFKK
ncbi:hypothetical protein ABPG72_021050 [Tetrahymena utriculariae]